MLEPPQHGLWGEYLAARGRKLACQWQSVEPAADLVHHTPVVTCQGEVWLDAASAIDEQRHRGVVAERLNVLEPFPRFSGIGERQRRHRELLFTAQAQRDPARRQD